MTVAQDKEKVQLQFLVAVLEALEPWLLEVTRGNASSEGVRVARLETAELLVKAVREIED